MGICKFCGKNAGVLRKEHKECRIKHDNMLGSLPQYISNHVFSFDVSSIVNRVNESAREAFLSEEEVRKVFITGWEYAVQRAFDDGVLSEDEEEKLTSYINFFPFQQEELDCNGWFTRLVHGAVLRDIMQGQIPDRQTISSPLPFNFMKSEKLIWVFQNVPYYNSVKRIQYAGGHQGISLRVMKGVYYRTGAFKGERFETDETRYIDSGLLAITTKHIYFAGESKSFRIKLDKIVTFQPYSDGIGIQRDAASAKPQSFMTGDGWFTYNLLMNVRNLES